MKSAKYVFLTRKTCIFLFIISESQKHDQNELIEIQKTDYSIVDIKNYRNK